MLLNIKIKNNDNMNSGLMQFKALYTQGQFILFHSPLSNRGVELGKLAEIVENG